VRQQETGQGRALFDLWGKLNRAGLRRGFRCPLRSWPRPYTGKPVPGSGPPKPVSGGGSALRFLKARRGGAVVLLVDLDANLAAMSRWREIARVGAALTRPCWSRAARKLVFAQREEVLDLHRRQSVGKSLLAEISMFPSAHPRALRKLCDGPGGGVGTGCDRGERLLRRGRC
jgi:hypothetical protein